MLKSPNAFRIGVFVSLVLIFGQARAEVRLHPLFGDHAVLQAKIPIPIWGWDDPGQEVIVKFAGQTHATTTDPDGNWKAMLEPLAYGGPHELTVEGSSRVIRRDVLAGEVWLAGGQSNMEWSHNSNPAKFQDIDDVANIETVRLFQVKDKGSAEILSTVEGEWKVSSPESLRPFSIVGWNFARVLNADLGQPIGIIDCAWGGTIVETWTSMKKLETTDVFKSDLEAFAASREAYPEALAAYEKALAVWEKAREEGQDTPQPAKPMHAGDRNALAALYNGMIAPLAPYGVRGAIWYQGESNAGTDRNPASYGQRMVAMIEDWREAWNNPVMPFYMVQLAPFGTGDTGPAGLPNYALVREGQQWAADNMTNTGLVATMDIGDCDDIHPAKKRPVGERLASVAKALTYGFDVGYSGPVFDEMSVAGNEATIRFRHTHGGLKAEGAVKGFMIAGADRVFYPADARIEGETVVAGSPDVAEPVAVRYGFENCPDTNVFNELDLPAFPFRTDDWTSATIAGE